MPQAPIYSSPLDGALPRARCTKRMEDAVLIAAKKHGVSAGSVVRACVAYALELHQENSDLVKRMFTRARKYSGDASSSSETN